MRFARIRKKADDVIDSRGGRTIEETPRFEDNTSGTRQIFILVRYQIRLQES